MTSEERPFQLRDVIAPMAAGWAAYAVFRMVQTVLFAHLVPELSIMSDTHRIILSATDGALMMAMTPVAVWASVRFPIDRRHTPHIALHAVLGLVLSFAMMAALVGVGKVVTGVSIKLPFVKYYVAWVTGTLFAYAVAVAVAHALHAARVAHDAALRAARLEAQLSEVRLDALRTQLQPHFLFNTLHTISELVHTDPDAADAMVMQLAALLRRTLDTSTQDTVTVDDELEYISCYVDIHRVRLGDRLRVEYDIGAGLRQARVPALILQPLVENALHHGIFPLPEGGTVVVRARAAAGRLALTVADDGAGPCDEAVEGIGLTNTRRRLRALFGDAQSVELRRREPRGAELIVTLPLR